MDVKTPPEDLISLADRLEEEAVAILSSGKSITIHELETALRGRIQPLFTPIREYLMHLLDSYAEEETPGSGRWIIKVNEHPALRGSDHKTIVGMITSLGKQFGMALNPQPQTVDWTDPISGDVLYRFQVLTNARFSHLVSRHELTPVTRILVLPGSRSNLVAYKRQTNPWLNEQLDDGWHIIKFRHLARLVENPMLTRDVFDLLLDNDPTEYQPRQMQLL